MAITEIQKEVAKQSFICQKCKRSKKGTEFYLTREKKPSALCKDCETMHIDNYNPDTFMWLMEKYDIPYIPVEWDKLRDAAFAREGLKMNGKSVFGRYLGKMKLIQYSKYRYKDGPRLQAAYEEKLKLEQERNAELMKDVPNDGSWESLRDHLNEQLEKGLISKAQYETLMPKEALLQAEIAELQQAHASEIAHTPLGQLADDIGKSHLNQGATIGQAEATALAQGPQFYKESDYVSKNDLPDIGADLTADDRIRLALKWGRMYTPAQCVEMEAFYDSMMDSFDIQDADSESALRLICKTNLKMNEALDLGD